MVAFYLRQFILVYRTNTCTGSWANLELIEYGQLVATLPLGCVSCRRLTDCLSCFWFSVLLNVLIFFHTLPEGGLNSLPLTLTSNIACNLSALRCKDTMVLFYKARTLRTYLQRKDLATTIYNTLLWTIACLQGTPQLRPAYPPCCSGMLRDPPSHRLGLTSNIFVVDEDGTVCTAPSGVLMGGMRQLCIEACALEGIPVRLDAPDIATAGRWQEAFLTGEDTQLNCCCCCCSV